MSDFGSITKTELDALDRVVAYAKARVEYAVFAKPEYEPAISRTFSPSLLDDIALVSRFMVSARITDE
jgi:hypothetical protein